MKLQAGLFCRDGRVASAADLANLLAEFADWKSETSGESAEGPIAMAYRGDRIRGRRKPKLSLSTGDGTCLRSMGALTIVSNSRLVSVFSTFKACPIRSWWPRHLKKSESVHFT